MTSLVEVATFWPSEITIDDHQEALGLTDVEVRRYRRAFGLSEVRWDPSLSETDLMLAAARRLSALAGQEDRVHYVIRGRTVRSPSPYPLSPLQDVRQALGLPHAQTFAVTEHACASGLLALDLAAMLLDSDPDPSALALVLAGEKAFSRRTQIVPGVAVTGEATTAVLVSAGGTRDRLLAYATQTCPMPKAGLVMNDEDYHQFRKVYAPTLTKVVHAALAAAEMRVDELAMLLPHNVNRLAWIKLAEELGLPAERLFLDNVPRTGHCFGADPFLNYRTVADEGLLRPGDRYLMTSVGLGATFSAMVFEH
ncbi:3-oxoacyl-[acyl-carrier-protein] synthase III C-terminal domain-containing protein [Actinoplanes sp. NPDC051346]|uniref:3-oxoacyl-[acyl-carrier-protein] synthase III C-terminal domain-containing protein n=1 Tax=Actinoplanes sp. NPDC051346 TaxID=3155048 RepID=UPI0034364F83